MSNKIVTNFMIKLNLTLIEYKNIKVRKILLINYKSVRKECLILFFFRSLS